MARNSRTPEMMIGDTLAMAAACTITEKRLSELMDKFGLETVLACFEAYAGRARDAMRRLIHALPEGRVAFTDFLDDDGVREGHPRLCVAWEKIDGRLRVDYTGTSEQAEGAIKAQLTATQSQTSLAKFVKAFRAKWKAKTDCRSGFVIKDCKQFKEPKTSTTTTPGAP